MAALAAVEAYNRPGKKFRTAQFLVMMVIAWTALLHAIFYWANIKPWHSEPRFLWRSRTFLLAL